MGYVKVKEESEDILHLCREPSARAWAILIALIALGLGAALYSVDYLVWKLAYFSGAVFVGLSCMEDWEDAVFDKKTGQITFKKQSLMQKLFQATQGQKVVVANANEVISVNVREEDMKYGSTGYVVVLNFMSGYSMGVTEVATSDDRSEHELVAKKIRQFLQLDDSTLTSPGSEGSNGEDIDHCSTTSDESFEQIDKSELVDEEEDMEEKVDRGKEDAAKED